MASTTVTFESDDPQYFQELGDDFITEFKADPDSEVESECDLNASPERSYEEFDDDANIDGAYDAAGDASSAEWGFGCSQPHPLPFTGTSGLLIKMEDTTPLNYFHLMVNNEMMEHIVTETNRYANDMLCEKELAPRSRFRKWVDVTLREIWAFFGLVIAMGLMPLDDLEDYWSTHFVYEHPMFSAVMKRDRFMLILSFLHVCNNHERPPQGNDRYDPLFKIHPFISALRNNFKSVFAPGKNLTIKETMITWRGALSCEEFTIDNHGVNVYELCDSSTGYCHSFEIFTGRKECPSHDTTFHIVDRLTAPYSGSGRRLYTDTSCTSPYLFSHLKELDILACGVLRQNKNFGPPKEMLPKLNKKDNKMQVLTNGTLNLFRFWDRKEVNILTTAHDDSEVLTEKLDPLTKKPILKLSAVHQYNKYMKGVDRSDKTLQNNAFRRRTIKWWKKGFFHMFMMSVLNAYIIQRATSAGKKLYDREFRRELVTQLVEWAPIPLCPSAMTTNVGDSALFRLTARHFPNSIVTKPGQKNKYPQRDCVVCTKPNKRLSSRYECRICNVGLHVDPCFKLYHSVKDYKQAFKRKNPDP